MTANEGFLDSDGGKIWYKIYGAEKTATPLIVLHGGPGFSHDYLEPLNGLAGERPVIFYDQTDCGNSTRRDDPTKWRVDCLGQELSHICSHLGLKQCHALGHSFASAVVVSSLLEARCTAIKSMILASPLLKGSLLIDDIKSAIESMPEIHRAPLRAVSNNDASKFSQAQLDEAQSAFLKRFYCCADPWPECLYKSIGKQNTALYNHMIGPSLFNFTGIMSEYDISGRLGEITVPVLLTWGANECVKTVIDKTAFFNQAIPGARTVIFDNAAHMPHLETTDIYLKVVGDFLRDCDYGDCRRLPKCRNCRN